MRLGAASGVPPWVAPCSMPAALSVAARMSGRQVVGNVHAVGAVEEQPQGGTLAALDREREGRLGQQERRLAEDHRRIDEEHDPRTRWRVAWRK